MRKNRLLVIASALIILGQSCKKDDNLTPETRIDDTPKIKSETKILKGKPVAEGEAGYHVGLLRTKATEVKVQPGDCKFQVSLQ
ncbi:hypothetical protein [Sphingobacterium sp. GVS05A]|uniref:hypothetical protein n=1 Tax=Sphingobacterium sp. GVS05A TaxID=2862679 RepID=UPI001CBBC36E|nr:hypothetical protein [Sphingobacterium sp. GVS05A]